MLRPSFSFFLPLLLTSLAGHAAAASYRYYRFEALGLQSAGTVIQLSEFNFSYKGTKLNLQANNPEITPGAVGQNGTATAMVPVTVTGGERAVTDVEGSIKIVDGSLDTKWLTAITANNGAARFLNFDFGKATSIDAYQFATGGDTATYPNRNPVSWRLSGSADGETWVTLDRRLGYATPPQNKVYLPEFTATGVFPPTIYAFGLAEGQPMIVKDGSQVLFRWDTWDEDLDEAETTSISPAIAFGNLEPVATDFKGKTPKNADTTFTLTAVNHSMTATATLLVRSVTGGATTSKFYRFTPRRTRSGADPVQLSEFAFYNGGEMLNLKATNATTAPTTGTNGTTWNMRPVKVTNPGGSNDPNATNGALKLVDGATTQSRFMDNNGKPVVFEFETPTTIDSYRFTTSDEGGVADPVRWTMEGSADGVTWTMIENVTAFDYPTPSARSTDSQIFPLPGVSLKQEIVTKPAITWTGQAGTDYNVAGNWSGSKVPVMTEEIAVASGQAVVNANLEREAATSLSGTGVLTINGRLINRGRVEMSGGTLTQSGNYFLVGNTAPGTFNHSGGTVVSTHDRGWYLSDFTTAGGSRYNLSGAAKLQVTSTGGGNYLYNVHVGKGGEKDVFNMTGGTASFTSTADNNVYVSRNSSMLVSGGTLEFHKYTTFTLGFEGGGDNHLGISGGTVTLDAMPLHVGAASDGSVTLEGGTLVIGKEINLAKAAGKGSFLMTGGDLTAASIVSTANGSFHYQGGTIRLTGDQRGVLTQTWFKAAAGTTAVYNATQNSTLISVGGTAASPLATWLAAAGLSGTNATALADPDGDGVANILEFALNGAAGSSQSQGISGLVAGGGTGVLTAAIRNGASFSPSATGSLTATVDGVRYEIQGSTDLSAWTAEVEETTLAAGTLLTPESGWTLRSFRLKAGTPAVAGRGFLRISATEAP